MEQELLDLLVALDTIRQDPRFHPEGCALFHSLQAFDLACRDTSDRELWAAALLHDVGKALGSADHAEVGADLLDGLVTPRVVWLVRHHLDLLHAPGPTKRRLRGTQALADLQRLRRWDVGGRSPRARVMSPDAALAMVLDGTAQVLCSPLASGSSAHDDDDRKDTY